MNENTLFTVFWMALAFCIMTLITNININSIVAMKLNVERMPLKIEASK